LIIEPADEPTELNYIQLKFSSFI